MLNTESSCLCCTVPFAEWQLKQEASEGFGKAVNFVLGNTNSYARASHKDPYFYILPSLNTKTELEQQKVC